MEISPNRRDVALPRRERRAVGTTADPAAESTHPSFREFAVAIDQIDLHILEAQRVRSTLHSEGERLNREITRYVGTTQSLFATLAVIRQSIEPFGSADSLFMVRRSPPLGHI